MNEELGLDKNGPSSSVTSNVTELEAAKSAKVVAQKGRTTAAVQKYRRARVKLIALQRNFQSAAGYPVGCVFEQGLTI